MSRVRRAVDLGVAIALGVLVVLQLLPDTLVVEGDDKRDQWIDAGDVSLLGAARALNYAPDEGRYSLSIAVAEAAPGVVVYDLDAPSTVGAGSLLTVGRADRVVPIDGSFDVDDIDSSRAGMFWDGSRWRPWSLSVADGPPAALVAARDGARTILVDVRLLDDPPEEVALEQGARGPSLDVEPPRSGGVAGALEGLLLVGLMVGGGALLPRTALRPALRPALALLVGVALQASLGSLGRGWLTLGLPAVAVVSVSLVARARGALLGWRRSDLGALLVAGVGLVTIGAASRTFGAVFVSTDTLGYLIRAAQQAAAPSGVGLPSGQSAGLSSLHAVGVLGGVDGLFAIGAATLLATIVIAVTVHRDYAPRPTSWILLSLVALLLLSSSQFRTFAVLVNSHLLVAALAVSLVMLRHRAAQCSNDALSRCSAVAVATMLGTTAAAIVLLRPEGVTVLALLLLGTVATPRPPVGWQGAWYGGGFATLLDNLAAVGVLLGGPAAVDSTRAVLLATGAVLLVAPAAIRFVPQTVRRMLPAAALAALWVAFGALVASGHPTLTGLLEVTRINLFTGQGGWGVSAVGLTVALAVTLAVAALGVSARDAVRPLVTLVVGFVPVAAFVRGIGTASPGRVHWHDSVNRMWVHILLAVLLIVALRGADAVAREATHRIRPRQVGAVLAAATVALTPAFLWQPTFAREVTEPELVLVDGRVAAASADVAAAVDLAPSRSLRAELLPTYDAPIPVSDSAAVELCIEVPVATKSGTATGVITVEVPAAAAVISRDVTGLRDVIPEPFCFTWTDDAPTVRGLVADLGSPVGISIEASAAPEGVSPLVLVDAQGVPALTVVVRWRDGAAWEEPFLRHGPRIAAVTVGLLLLGSLVGRSRREVVGGSATTAGAQGRSG